MGQSYPWFNFYFPLWIIGLPNFLWPKGWFSYSVFYVCLHDNTKQIMVKLHTLQGRWFQYLVYLNNFNTACLIALNYVWLGSEIEWNQTQLYAYFWCLTFEPKLTRYCVQSSSIYWTVKVARPGFSLTIPTLFWTWNTNTPQTEQEIELYLFVGYRLKFRKVGFSRDRRIHSNTVTSLLLLLVLNF